MTWIDELREELNQRDGDGASRTQAQADAETEQDVAQARKIVRGLLEQMNLELLAGRGSVWESQVAWGLRLWELWWGQTRIEGNYLVVTLLRDSRGTPYLKLNRRRLPLRDPRLERRLQRALRSAFLQPRSYTVQTPALTGRQDLQRSS